MVSSSDMEGGGGDIVSTVLYFLWLSKPEHDRIGGSVVGQWQQPMPVEFGYPKRGNNKQAKGVGRNQFTRWKQSVMGATNRNRSIPLTNQEIQPTANKAEHENTHSPRSVRRNQSNTSTAETKPLAKGRSKHTRAGF